MIEIDDRPDLIDRDWYVDCEIFDLEQQRIFRRAWHFACLLSDVPQAGDYYTLTVAGQPIIVLRGKDGVVRAFLNACTHRGATLTEDCAGASGNCGGALQCMYHAWTFDTTGALIGVPHSDAYGPEFSREDHGLVGVHCDAFGSLVFVAIDPLRPTLLEFLGEAADWIRPAVENLEVLGRASWIYHGNWKLWHENHRDNYHPIFVHANVLNLTPDFGEGGSNHGLTPGHSMLRWPVKPPDFERYDRSLKKVSGLDVSSIKVFSPAGRPVDRTPWRNIFALFPNMDFQQPGQFASGLQVVNPISVDTTRVDIAFLAPVGEDEATRRYRLQTAARTTGSWGETAVDDCEAAERTTIGMGSDGTRYSNIARGRAPGLVGETSDEYSLREFYREYRYYLRLEEGRSPR